MLVCHIGWSTFKLTESQVFTFCKKKNVARELIPSGIYHRSAFSLSVSPFILPTLSVPFKSYYHSSWLCRWRRNLLLFHLPHCSYSGSSSHLHCRVKALNRVGLQCGLSFLVFFLYFLSDCVITRFHRWLCRVIFCNVLVTPQSDL